MQDFMEDDLLTGERKSSIGSASVKLFDATEFTEAVEVKNAAEFLMVEIAGLYNYVFTVTDQYKVVVNGIIHERLSNDYESDAEKDEFLCAISKMFPASVEEMGKRLDAARERRIDLEVKISALKTCTTDKYYEFKSFEAMVESLEYTLASFDADFLPSIQLANEMLEYSGYGTHLGAICELYKPEYNYLADKEIATALRGGYTNSASDIVDRASTQLHLATKALRDAISQQKQKVTSCLVKTSPSDIL